MYYIKMMTMSHFLLPSLSGPTHLLRWVVWADVAFYFFWEHNNRHRSAVGCTGTPIITSQDPFNMYNEFLFTFPFPEISNM
jgi:hypothetical protein